jgi:hypothetical protein
MLPTLELAAENAGKPPCFSPALPLSVASLSFSGTAKRSPKYRATLQNRPVEPSAGKTIYIDTPDKLPISQAC